jgi:hypothetical protein
MSLGDPRLAARHRRFRFNFASFREFLQRRV